MSVKSGKCCRKRSATTNPVRLGLRLRPCMFTYARLRRVSRILAYVDGRPTPCASSSLTKDASEYLRQDFHDERAGKGMGGSHRSPKAAIAPKPSLPIQTCGSSEDEQRLTQPAPGYMFLTTSINVLELSFFSKKNKLSQQRNQAVPCGALNAKRADSRGRTASGPT